MLIESSTHINYTLHTHLSGLFLPWHRHFIHLWETALRDECGYKGFLPYDTPPTAWIAKLTNADIGIGPYGRTT